MSTLILSSNKLFWGGVIWLSSIIIGSCYYLYTLLPDDENDCAEDIRDIVLMQNGQIDEVALMKIMVKIEDIANKLYERDYKKQDEKRRSIMNNLSIEYNELCKEQIENKDFINRSTATKVLAQLKTHFTLEQFQEHLKKIQLNRLEALTMKYYKIPNECKLPSIEKIKEAYKYFNEQFFQQQRIIEEKYSNVPNKHTSNQEKIIAYMMNSVYLDDLLVQNYGINTQTMTIVLSKANCFNTDIELNKLKEQLDAFNQSIAKLQT